jgi:hypothetical protein
MVAGTAPLQEAQYYSSQAVAQAAGIPLTTILAWERRYGVPRPRRARGGRRVYSAADLALVQAMRARTAAGVRAEVAARDLLAAGGDPDDRCGVVPTYVPTEVRDVQCLHCGETTGELLRQYMPDGPCTRFVLAHGVLPPRRGPGGRPRCGRCGGDLYAEPAASRSMPPVPHPGAVPSCDAA